MSTDTPDRREEKARDAMVRQLRQNLARCRRVILDEKMDLKTQERWIQLYNNTSQVLNQILKDRQMRDWEKRLREIEKYRGIQKKTVQSETDPPDSNTTYSNPGPEDRGSSANLREMSVKFCSSSGQIYRHIRHIFGIL
jgi:hypothetical protein